MKSWNLRLGTPGVLNMEPNSPIVETQEYAEPYSYISFESYLRTVLDHISLEENDSRPM